MLEQLRRLFKKPHRQPNYMYVDYPGLGYLVIDVSNVTSKLVNKARNFAFGLDTKSNSESVYQTWKFIADYQQLGPFKLFIINSLCWLLRRLRTIEGYLNKWIISLRKTRKIPNEHKVDSAESIQ